MTPLTKNNTNDIWARFCQASPDEIKEMIDNETINKENLLFMNELKQGVLNPDMAISDLSREILRRWAGTDVAEEDRIKTFHLVPLSKSIKLSHWLDALEVIKANNLYRGNNVANTMARMIRGSLLDHEGNPYMDEEWVKPDYMTSFNRLVAKTRLKQSVEANIEPAVTEPLTTSERELVMSEIMSIQTKLNALVSDIETLYALLNNE